MNILKKTMNKAHHLIFTICGHRRDNSLLRGNKRNEELKEALYSLACTMKQ